MKLTISIAILSAFLSSACGQHSIRRAALVPHQQPVAHSGVRPQTTEYSIGTPNLFSTVKPRAEENAGIVVPRWEGQGSIRMPVGDAMTLGFHADYGLDAGSVELAADQPDPKGDTIGGAISMFFTANITPKFDLGVGGQLWIYSIPYVEYTTCLDCQQRYSTVEHDRDQMSVVSLAILPTFKLSPNMSVFGGLNIRNHPTIEKSGTNIDLLTKDEEVEFGPFNAIVCIGADLMLNERVKFTGYVHHPITAKPVSYGFTTGFMLSILSSPPVPTTAARAKAIRRPARSAKPDIATKGRP